MHVNEHIACKTSAAQTRWFVILIIQETTKDLVCFLNLVFCSPWCRHSTSTDRQWNISSKCGASIERGVCQIQCGPEAHAMKPLCEICVNRSPNQVREFGEC